MLIFYQTKMTSKIGFRFIFLVLIGISTSIITFGSLINFHQYKIWGKPLIPEFVGYKSDHDKSVKVTRSEKTTFGGNLHNGLSSLFSAGQDQSSFGFYPVLIGTRFILSDFSIPAIYQNSSHGLRGPPVA